MNKGIYTKGVYKTKVNGKYTREYVLWRDVLKRAYSASFHIKRPTYTNVEVEDYLLDFQHFAEFVNTVPFYNFRDDKNNRYQIDKDILSTNIKIYSRDTICFIPQELNLLLVKRDNQRGLLPVGISYYKRNGMFRAKMKSHGHDKHIGYYLNYIDAFKAYKEHKEQLIRELATEFFSNNKIEERVYLGLMNYKVVDDRSEDIKLKCNKLYK